MKTIYSLLIAVGLLALAGCGEKTPVSPETSTPVQASPSPSSSPSLSTSPAASPSAKPANTAAASATPGTSPRIIPALERKAAFDLLEKASELKDIYTADKSYSKSELYAYFAPYYTNQYVDQILLRNMKQTGDKWTVAYPNSELVEGSYYEAYFTEKTRFEQNGDKVIITNSLDAGLSEAHDETVTLLYTSNGWRIDQLVWKMKK
jgi:hypothetical protein